MADPQAWLRRLDGSEVAFNDDCDEAEIEALIGRPLTTAMDACIVIDVIDPDSYYVEISDVDGGSGNALVGVTQVPNQ